MKITFEIALTDDERDPYAAREIRPVNDGDVWRPSPLEGHAKSLYSAIAKLCFMNLEMAGKTDEIFMLFSYYAGIYPEAAQKAIADTLRFTGSNSKSDASNNAEN